MAEGKRKTVTKASGGKKYIEGLVKRGLGIGAKLGFPTINMDPLLAPTDLKFGVYAVIVEIGQKKIGGALYFGPRLLHGDSLTLEAYLFTTAKNLYGKNVRIEILKRLRGPKKFADEKALVKAIGKDVKKAGKILPTSLRELS